MGFSESILVAMFTLVVVFCVLTVLMLIVRLFSYILTSLTARKIMKTQGQDLDNANQQSTVEWKSEDIFSTGAIRLKNVDEPSAAMIMAIVSDESGIPLEELCFKSISLINE